MPSSSAKWLFSLCFCFALNRASLPLFGVYSLLFCFEHAQSGIPFRLIPAIPL